jgi:hypothetical protein
MDPASLDSLRPRHEKAVTTNGESVDCRSIIKDGFHDGKWGKKNAEGDVEYLDDKHMTALHIVLEKIEALVVNEDDDDDERDGAAISFDISIAASEISQCIDVVHLLIQHGADVNVKDSDGRVPLHQAVTAGRRDVIETLFAAGADPTVGGK